MAGSSKGGCIVDGSNNSGLTDSRLARRDGFLFGGMTLISRSSAGNSDGSEFGIPIWYCPYHGKSISIQ
jgi:hypothetical protein